MFSLLVRFFMVLICIEVSLIQAEETDRESAVESKHIKVVTTFSVLSDLVSQVGGEHVEVHSLVGWDEDAHVFNPSPTDVRQLTNADLLVSNGLGFEGWLDRLVVAATYRGRLLVVTDGVDLIHLEGDDEKKRHHDHAHHIGHEAEVALYDPHAWHSLKSAKVYIENIAQALQLADAEHAGYFKKNAELYLSKLATLEKTVDLGFKSIPAASRHIVVPHNAFAYLARDFDLEIHSLQGVSTEAETSAAQIAQVIRQVRAFNIKAIFSENISDKRLMNVVRLETGVNLGGALISGALSNQLAPTYLDMMAYNLNLIIESLKD